ncbi:MAG: hypothetical protein MUF42_16540 [Cytophagaceae bacterium]|jgi:hypothetical protein|nr:hypothetical protein [Cytophagaceae bacterium]
MKQLIVPGLLLLAIQLFAQSTSKKYLYSDRWEAGSPSGYFGERNGTGMKIIHNFDTLPYSGQRCIRIQTNGIEAWSGFFALSAGKWRAELNGDTSRLQYLHHYENLVLHIRAKEATTVNISFGEHSEPNTSLEDIAVTSSWRKVVLPLNRLHLYSINGLFGITLRGAATVYLDEIYVEGKAGAVMVEKAITQKTSDLRPIKVSIEKTGEDAFVLMRDGKPYYVKGAGGHVYMDRIKKYGGNSLRTWSHDGARAILDSAHAHGLTVMMGLWMQHERHGFNYDDKEAVYYQLLQFKDAVTELKDHPALLAWAVGNEVDLFYKNTNVWNAVQDVASMIHRIDPNHPTTTVTAGLDAAEIKLINERCPDIDFMSINTYGDLENTVPAGIRKADWKGAYMITEWGPTGHWEIANTDFKIPIEQTSSEKASVYRQRYQKIESDSGKCLGSYVFLWGNKQETTPTWYSMFLNDGSESEVIDVMQYNWSGQWPANKAPSIADLKINGKTALENVYLSAGVSASASATIIDPENKKIKYTWVIMPESTDKKAGGDFEKTPAELKGLIKKGNSNQIIFTTPKESGAYRLFIYAYDDNKNLAYGNIPFYVK